MTERTASLPDNAPLPQSEGASPDKLSPDYDDWTLDIPSGNSATPRDFLSFHAYCALNGCAPGPLLRDPPAVQHVNAPFQPSPEMLETMFLARMPELIGDIAAFMRRREGLAAQVAAITRQTMDRRLSRGVLNWLDREGYNLSWLFFGFGRKIEDYQPRNMGDQDERIVPLDCAGVRDLRGLCSGWTGSDWFWLHGGRYMRSIDAPPSMTITARAVACFTLTPLTPLPPDPTRLFMRVRDLASTIDRAMWVRDDWHHYILKRLQKSIARAGMLIGLTPAAAAAYMAGKAQPAETALKALLVLDTVLERFGKAGLLGFLDLLNDEAASRGFADLSEVFQQRTWSREDAAEGSRGER